MPGSSPDFATEDDSIDISPDEELLLSLPPVLESIVMVSAVTFCTLWRKERREERMSVI